MVINTDVLHHVEKKHLKHLFILKVCNVYLKRYMIKCTFGIAILRSIWKSNDYTLYYRRRGNGNRGCHPFEPALYNHPLGQTTHSGCDFLKVFFFLSLLPPQQNSICLLWRKVHLLLLKERKNSLRKFINQSERFWFHFLCRKSKVI